MDEAQALARLGSWELDTRTGDIQWTRELFRIIGVDPAEGPPTLTTLSVHLHPEDRSRVLENIERATRTGEPYTIDYRIITNDGVERQVVSNGNPVRADDGAVVRINGTLQDVTEANAAAQDLSRVNAELRRANELNADVLAMLGHDIRNPIGAVRGYLELLDDDWDALDESERRGFVAKTRAATARLSAMVDQILALVAVDSGRIEPHREPVHLADALEQIAQGSGLPSVPAVELGPGTPEVVFFDPVHLEQILGNLLSNAYRYGVEPVRVSTSHNHGTVSIAVTDGGPGVPPAQADSLFVRFVRTGSLQSAAGGTGFGLYMAARLAQANGATLGYRPAQEGRPHAFVLTLGLHDT
jgi:PAS domain S-box-containing protein